MSLIDRLLGRRDDAMAAVYDRLVGLARRPDWYREGGIPDSVDGRFALVSTMVALGVARLEAGGPAGVRASAVLTERFVADMDAQLRQDGFDTTLGKKVRRLVTLMAARLDAWRAHAAGTPLAEVADALVGVDGAPATPAAVALLAAAHDEVAAVPVDRLVAGQWA